MKKIWLLLVSISIVFLLMAGCSSPFSKVLWVEEIPSTQYGRIWLTFDRYENTKALLPTWPNRTQGTFAIVTEKQLTEKGDNLEVILRLVLSDGTHFNATPYFLSLSGYFLTFNAGDLVVINQSNYDKGKTYLFSQNEIIIIEKNAVWNTTPYY